MSWENYKKIFREVIRLALVRNKSEPRTYLIKKEEAYIVSTLEMYGLYVLPQDARILANELKQVLHGVGKRMIAN